MLNRFKIYFLALLLPLLTPLRVLAVSEFSTSYNVDYQVTKNGTTHTTFKIDLKNNLSNIYASEFSLSIGSTKLENIKEALQICDGAIVSSSFKPISGWTKESMLAEWDYDLMAKFMQVVNEK